MAGVTYVTLNVHGSCNNLCDTAPDPTEWAARNQANIAWLRETFRFAAALRQSAAVMIVSQADPGWDATYATRAPLRDPKTLAETDGQPDGFQDYLVALREEVIAFRRPVAYVHGDSHYHRIDRPLLDSQGRRLENFTRVETFGDNQANGTNDVNWLRVNVDPGSREVFTYQAQIVPANRTTVPAPVGVRGAPPPRDRPGFDRSRVTDVSRRRDRRAVPRRRPVVRERSHRSGCRRAAACRRHASRRGTDG